MFPVSCSSAAPRAGLTFRCEIVADAPGPGTGYPGPRPASPRTAPLACHMQKGREAAYIWQAVPKEVTTMQDFKRGTVRANQLTFEYLTAGDGPLALCVHGFP